MWQHIFFDKHKSKDSPANMEEKTVIKQPAQQQRKIKNGAFYRFVKRTFDLLASLLAIILLSWLLIIILIIQLFATKGHPFFADPRVGKRGNMIKVLKFRTMYFDAESNIDKYLSSKQKEVWLRERKLDDDPRITKFGKFLRKTSLDELPQLINIFIGQMSVVGPRPMSSREVKDEFTDEQRIILFLARPGLTGYWQVNGRSNVDFISGKRQEMEIEYFYKRSLWFDFCLIILTIPAVFKRKGAK